MKYFFSLLALMLNGIPGWAQCELDVSLTDATCVNVADECAGDPAMHDCRHTTFAAPCTQNYNLEAKVSCTGGADCKYCVSEVWVCKPDGSVVTCTDSHCGPNSACAHTTLVPLTQGITYTLYVCKVNCGDYDLDCDDCSANCTAWARVFD